MLKLRGLKVLEHYQGGPHIPECTDLFEPPNLDSQFGFRYSSWQEWELVSKFHQEELRDQPCKQTNMINGFALLNKKYNGLSTERKWEVELIHFITFYAFNLMFLI